MASPLLPAQRETVTENIQTQSLDSVPLPAMVPQHQTGSTSDPFPQVADASPFDEVNYGSDILGIDYSLYDFHTELGSNIAQTEIAQAGPLGGSNVEEKILQYAMIIANVVSRIKIPGVLPVVKIVGNGMLTLTWMRI